jgi:hypothetical protein
MSIFKRRILTIFFILLFLVLAPLIIFYANGNILSEGWNILATGGIFLKSMESGSELYIDNKLKDTTGFFTRDYLLKNLKPDSYDILVKKEGYNTWENTINVDANRVTESNVFMLPTKIEITEISKYLEVVDKATTTNNVVKKDNPEYIAAKTIFADTSILGKYISIISTTTGKITKYEPGVKENPIENRHMIIWKEGHTAFIGWNGTISSSPKIFCKEVKNDITCVNSLKVYSFEGDINDLDFFPGESEVIIVSVLDKVYAIEAEENVNKKTQIIYAGKKPDFRNLNNTLYIKDGDFIGIASI